MRCQLLLFVFFFSSRRRHTRWNCDWSSDVCSSDLVAAERRELLAERRDERAVENVELPRMVDRDMRHATGGALLDTRVDARAAGGLRSEERRVGKERRARWRPADGREERGEGDDEV